MLISTFACIKLFKNSIKILLKDTDLKGGFQVSYYDRLRIVTKFSNRIALPIEVRLIFWKLRAKFLMVTKCESALSYGLLRYRDDTPYHRHPECKVRNKPDRSSQIST